MHSSRDRHRGYEREWDERDIVDSRRPRYRDDEYEYHERHDDDDDEDTIDYNDYEDVELDERSRPREPRRQSRQQQYQHRDLNAGRGYRYERFEGDDEEGDGGDVRARSRSHAQGRSRRRDGNRAYGRGHDDGETSEEAIFVDARPNFAKPPSARPSTGVQRGHGHGQGHGNVVRESPTTTPRKNRDRRRRESTADEDYHHDRRARDKRGGERERERTRERDRDREREKAKERHRQRRSRSRAEIGAESGGDRRKKEKRDKHINADSANSATQLLSLDAISKLNALNHRNDAKMKDKEKREEKQREKEREKEKEKERRRRKKKGYGLGQGQEKNRKRDREGGKRHASGALLEEGRSPELRTRGGGYSRREKWEKRGGGGGDGEDDDGDGRGRRCGGCLGSVKNWSLKKKILVTIGLIILLLIIVIPVAVTASGNGDDDSDPKDPATTGPSNGELDDIDRDDIPADAKGTYLDPFSWFDTADFNVTYTDETVGGLPVMGLKSSWDDSARPNDNVPPLDKKFEYGKTPIRGVNVGGWLSIEPFITPSFFKRYSARDNVVDEYSLTKKLGNMAKETIEKHYATFITEQSFREIRDAGFDHVRIPYSYWAVTKYDGDPYEVKLSWRYLLRAIEYCRKYGLRVSLDLHGGPGSQNGWNHSGKHGTANWLNGTDGDEWGQRSLDLHDQLSKFFAQPRYKNVIGLYGLMNEPMMLKMKIEPVLEWTTKAAKIIDGNGMKQHIIFADGFLKLSKWKTMLQDTGYNLVLDTHQYTIFNSDLITMTHTKKVNFVCDGWTDLIGDSNSKKEGWGPTICGEWSQADTDCAPYVNNVHVGSRWTGTMTNPSAKDHITTPLCPTAQKGSKSDKGCSCDAANADPSSYSDGYKKFLKMYAEAQIYAFEKGWGWFYWTWKTEKATQWSWKLGMEAGVLPEKAYAPEFKCDTDDIPDFGEELPEYY